MIKRLTKRFLRDERGATAIEYGLIMALMTVLIIGAIAAVGTGTSNNFNKAVDGFDQEAS